VLSKATMISLVSLILIGGGVLRIKYEVVFLRKILKGLENDLEKSTDNLNVLRAEWSYLNDPSRLEKLSEKYLKDLRPTENSQITNCNDLDNWALTHRDDYSKRKDTKSASKNELREPDKSQKSDQDLRRKSFDEFIKSSLKENSEEQLN
jgi:hypothetical protein